MMRTGSTRKFVFVLLLLATLLLGSILTRGEELTITWLMYGAPEQAPVYEEFARDFEAKHPGIKVQLLPMISSGIYRERLLTLFAAGEAPDVFLTFAQYRDSFIENGILYDLTNLFDASTEVSRDMYYPAIRDVFEIDDRIWGTPWGYNAKLWVINSDLREQRGLPSPDRHWTVDNFRDYARRMTSQQDGIIGTDASSSLFNSAGNLGWMYNYTGQYWIDPKTNEVHVDDPGMLAMLRFWLDLQHNYNAAAGYSIPRPAGGLRGGSIGMYETWSTEPHFLATLSGVGQWDWELASFPAGPVSNSHFAQGHLWSIPANHPNPEAAWKLVEYLGSYDAEVLWARTQRTPPQVHDPELWELYFNDVPSDKRKEALSFILYDLYAEGRARSFTYWPDFAEMELLMRSAISRVMNRQETPDAAMNNLARTFRAVLGNR